MSKSIATYPFGRAFASAEEVVGEIVCWHPANEDQERFLKNILQPGLADHEDIPEIEGISSWVAYEINQFLASHGFSIRLDPFRPEEFGFASVFELLLKWEIEGVSCMIDAMGERYPGVNMPDHTAFFKAEGYSERHNPYDGIIVKIAASGGDSVFMTMDDIPPSDSVLPVVARFLEDNLYPVRDFKGLRFPKVDLDLSGSIDWILGLGFAGRDGAVNVVRQAQQQNILKMNEKGALAKSAVAMGALRSALPLPRPFVIDRPFLVWVSRPGLDLPLFVAHVTPEDWKDPGELD